MTKPFTMLPCPPYHGRVTLHGCVKRHRDAQSLLEVAPARGNAALKRAELASVCQHCLDCELGRERTKILAEDAAE